MHLGVVLQQAVFVEMKEYTDLLEERIVHIRGRELSAVSSKAKEVEKNLHGARRTQDSYVGEASKIRQVF